MRTRTMGTLGPEVSVVGLGCNNFGMRIAEEESAAVVHAALDAGITHFDTAEMYGGGKSEEFLGRALAGHLDEVVIASKFVPRGKDDEYRPGALAARAVEGLETTLRRLGTERVDVYYQHYPDDDAPFEEVLVALDEQVRAGKIGVVACSNYTGEQLAGAAEVARDKGLAPFVADQVEWSLIKREAEQATAPEANRLGVGIVPYFPLASGLLTGKYAKGEPFPEGTRFAAASYFAAAATDENFAYVEALGAFAAERGHTVLELAIAWLAAQDGVCSVIAGATRPEQVRANAAAADWVLSAEDLAALPSRSGARRP